MSQEIVVTAHYAGREKLFAISVAGFYRDNLPRGHATRELSELIAQFPGYNLVLDGLTSGEVSHFRQVRPMPKQRMTQEEQRHIEQRRFERDQERYNAWLEKQVPHNETMAKIRQGPHYVLGVDLENQPVFVPYSNRSPSEK